MDTFQNLVESFPRRVEVVKTAKGTNSRLGCSTCTYGCDGEVFTIFFLSYSVDYTKPEWFVRKSKDCYALGLYC